MYTAEVTNLHHVLIKKESESECVFKRNNHTAEISESHKYELKKLSESVEPEAGFEFNFTQNLDFDYQVIKTESQDEFKAEAPYTKDEITTIGQKLK